MKKILLIPTLVATSATTVFGCISCSESKAQPTFFVDRVSMKTTKTTDIQLDWLPNDHSLIFNEGITFEYNNGKTASVTCDDLAARPLNISLTFNEEIVEKDITDGLLNFSYQNKTTKSKHTDSVKNIWISKYVPEPTGIVLNKFVDKTDYQQIETENTYAFNAGETYEFTIDMRKWETKDVIYSNFSFFLGTGENKTGMVKLTSTISFVLDDGRSLIYQLVSPDNTNIKFSNYGDVTAIRLCYLIRCSIQVDPEYSGTEQYKFLFVGSQDN